MSFLKSNGKEIDTRPIRYLATEGEKNADVICIEINRYYSNVDLSGCTFVMRGVNANGEISEQVLTKRTENNVIILEWQITEAFTAIPGRLQLELRGMSDDTLIIKYRMQPITIHCSVNGTGKPSPDVAEQILSQMEQMLDAAQELTAKMPIPQNGTWWLYNADTGAYEDSGQPAQGADGKDGQDGKDGADGAPGKDGADGAPGADGKDGAPGADGRDGQDGADGKSAYQIWLDAGNSGTELDFLASLKGEKGDTGEQGAPGADGQNGTDGKDGAPGADGKDGTDGQDGADGKSAYEIWIDAGNTGTEEEFLASLKGEKGEPGAAGADGKTPDVSNIENTVEALAAGLSDSGWMQLDSSCYVSGSCLDDTTTKIYYRKIGAMVHLCGKLAWTGTPVPTTIFRIPEEIRPYTNIPMAGKGTSTGAAMFSLGNDGYVLGGTGNYTETVYFSAMYMTNDAPADVSSLLAALADIVEV